MAVEEDLPRKLAAILYADVAGYSRLTSEDEERTHRRLSEYLDLMSAAIESHRGRVVHYAGDAVLADFGTVTEALSCAWETQQTLALRNDELPDERKVEFRIGVNLGEVIVDRDDIYGDGVNVAARLEGLAEPGGICVSESVRSAAGSKLALDFEFIGEREVKNIAEAVRAYRVVSLGDVGEQYTVACPYPGMVPFSFDDAQYFHGRGEEVKRMVQLLRRQRFMLVIGPSGSGKSSLVYAGLLAELERSRYFAKGHWLLRTMRPGAKPTEVLATVLGAQVPRGEFESRAVDAQLALHPPARRLLLLVDQFEEVFTQAGREECARFIAALQTLRSFDNCALILTLRADFYPDLMNSDLWPVDPSQRVEVAPLRGEALREAIQRPAADVGVRIEDELVNQLLADAADEPGALPLMQETMGLLWDDIERRTLSYGAYQRLSDDAGQGSGNLSGLAVAIAMKADATLAELNQRQQAIARRIFLRLIHFGENRADTRRQQPVASLRAANDASGEFERTLEHLTDNRLVTQSGGDEHNAPAVDISHESLIGGWSRLQNWINDRREAEQVRRRLQGKAAEWVRLGRASGGLLDEAELPEAERWLASADAADLGFDATLPELVDLSQRTIEAVERAHEHAREAELRQAQTLAEERRQRIVEAEKARLESVAQLLCIQALEQQAAQLDERGVLLARQAYHFSTQGSRSLRYRVDSVLRTVVGKPNFSPILLRAETEAIALSSDGTKLASSHNLLGKVLLWDLTRRGDRPVVLPGYPGDRLVTGYPVAAISALAFSPDGRGLVAANADGSVVRWNLESPQAPPAEMPRQKAGVWSVTFSPDGRWLAMGAKRDDTFTLWDLTKPEAAPVLVRDPCPADPGSGPPPNRQGGVAVAFSPDSATLVSGSLNGDIRLWQPNDCTAPVESPIGHDGSVFALAFSPDGNRLAFAGEGVSIRVWKTDEPVATHTVLTSESDVPVTSLSFDPDGTTLASARYNLVQLWNVDKPEEPPTRLPQTGTFRVMFTPDGRQLVAAAIESSYLRIYEMQSSGRPHVLTGHSVCSLALSPDNNLLASGAGLAGKTIELRQLDDLGAPPVVIRGHDGTVNSVNFSHDGKQLVTASWNANSLKLWDLEQSVPTFTSLPVREEDQPWTACFSPDGRSLVSGGAAGVYAWDLANLANEPVLLLPAKNWVTEFAFSPGGKRLAAASSDPTILVKELTSSNAPTFELNGHEGGVWSVAFSPDGETLASGGADRTVRLWDPNNPSAASTVLGWHNDAVYRVRFSPDGKWLATSSLDYSVHLWNLENPDAMPNILAGHENEVLALVFSADSKSLFSGGRDGRIRIWDLSHPLISSTTSEVAHMACEKVRRNLTLDEWKEFIGIDVPYERTCPSLPIHPSLFEAAGELAKENDIAGAMLLLERARDLDPELEFDPEQEAHRLAELDAS